MFQYGTNNTIDTTTMGYYFIKLFSEAHTLKEYTTYNRKTSTSGEIVVKTHYMNCTKKKHKVVPGK